MAQKLAIGVIGAGRIGQIHAKALAFMVPGAEVAAISDLRLDAARALAEECGAAKTTDDYKDIITDKSIDAVCICSTTDTHAQIMEEAAVVGKHVFCEKPIALELAAIDKALAAVEKAGIVLMLGFNRRYDNGNIAIRDAVSSGKVGVPELCLITSRDPAQPPIDHMKLTGGFFLDTSIHDFDIARYILQDEPEEVFSYAACRVDPRIGEIGDFDTCMHTLRFKNGAFCNIDNSRRATYGYDQRVEVFGSKGSIATVNKLENNTVFSDGDGIHTPPLQNFFLERYLTAYQAEGRIFVDCVQSGKTPPSGGYDGRISVVMAKAALKSVQEKRPVRMDEIKA